MAECGQKAVLIITRDVANTSTSVARRRLELSCTRAAGHAGTHEDSARSETWEGDGTRIVTLLRHEEPDD